MRAELREIWCESVDVSLDNYTPEIADNFWLPITLRIGAEGVSGTNDFVIHVCTPKALECSLRYEWNGMQFGSDIIVVIDYNINKIKDKISAYISSCSASNFNELMLKISKIASWEYQDCTD